MSTFSQIIREHYGTLLEQEQTDHFELLDRPVLGFGPKLSVPFTFEEQHSFHRSLYTIPFFDLPNIFFGNLLRW